MRVVHRHRGTLLWASALALALGFVAVDSAGRLRTLRAIAEEDISGLPPPQPDPNSPSGYAWNQHRLILPVLGMDGHHWILHTERMLAGEGARIRDSRHDNAPAGREVHWSGMLRWWAAGLATAYRGLRAEPSLPMALERVVPWANTLLLALLLAALAPLIAWRFGAGAAALFALGAVTAYPFYEYFVVGYFDHHGVATLLAAFSVVCLAGGGAGWTRNSVKPPDGIAGAERTLRAWLPSPRVARRWFAGSAAAAAGSLWISAATVVPVMFGIGVAALAGALVTRGTDPARAPWRFDASLWRVWGIAGAGLSVLLYLLEYFPGHLGMRLEVNHPLYALAWLGAGDFLCRASQWLHGPASSGGERRSRRPGWMLLDLALVALLPAVILSARESTFRLADPFLWALHREQIVEFLGLGTHLGRMSASGIMGGVSALPILAIPLLWLLWPTGVAGGRGRVWRGLLTVAAVPVVAFAYTVGFGLGGSRAFGLLFAAAILAALLLPPARRLPALLPPWRAALTLGLFPAALLLALSLSQVRWLGIACALWISALVMLASAAGRGFAWTRPRRALAGALLAATLLPFPLFTLQRALDGRGRDPSYPQSLIVHLATREVSQWLRARLGEAPGVVLAGATTTTLMVYFGGFQGLGTLYWENLEGLRAAAEIYSTPSPERARELIARRGVTHLVSVSWESDLYLRAGSASTLAGPEPGVRAAPEGPFLERMISAIESSELEALPAWLVALPYDLPTTAVLEGARVWILEVVPEQPEELALVRIARFHQAMGDPGRAARALSSSLGLRTNLPALALLARLHYVQGDTAALAATVARLRENLDQADGLDLEDRIDLTVAFGLAADAAETRRQFERALAAADERSVRRLSPESLSLLIGLSRQLGLTQGHEDVLGLALRLLPLPAQAEFR